MPWYCLKTQSLKEKLVVEQLRHRAGMEVYAPRFKAIKKTRKGKRVFVRYLFPGYVFVVCADDDQLRLARYTNGVLKFLKRGDAPAEVPADIIARLQDAYPEHTPLEAADPALEPGARVEIVDGSLKTLKATVLAHLPAEQRIRILIEFLGRENEISIPEDHAYALREGEEDD